MKFPIVSSKKLAQQVLEFLQIQPIFERDFAFSTLDSNIGEYDVARLSDLLMSFSKKDQMKGINIFNRFFFTLFGSGKNIDFANIFSAKEMALFAKEKLGDDVTLLEKGYTTTEDMQDGTLFVWCDEVMFISNGATYSVIHEMIYSKFFFAEGEPAYIVGNVSQATLDKVKH